MEASKVREGLWRWSVPHPAWKPEDDRPDGWGQMVSCVYAELDEAVVLIDPLVPQDPVECEKFWEALDRDVERVARPILVLVANDFHGRSADAVASRYLGSGRKLQVVGDAAIRDRVSCVLHATFDDVSLPQGLRAIPILGLSPGETAFALDPWRAVVFADAVLGAGDGEVRLAPPSWGVKTPEGWAEYNRRFRPSILPIARTRPDIILTSHGESILAGGGNALFEALAAPPWGEEEDD